jgi:hypothetical protein
MEPDETLPCPVPSFWPDNGARMTKCAVGKGPYVHRAEYEKLLAERDVLKDKAWRYDELNR